MTIHGHSKKGKWSRTYTSWAAMHARCNNPNLREYKNYGGRGIKVCERWKDFRNFLEDMGERPEGKTLDRFPSNNKDYSPNNCRWATRHEQRLNSRSKSSARGTNFHPQNKSKPWSAQIRIKGKIKSLGYFITEKEAHAVYVKARRRLDASR